MGDDNQHSRLSASAASRWMQCPGSVRLAKKAPKQKTKEHTAQGTAAHKLAESCLRLEIDAKDMLGSVIETDGFKFTVDADMSDAVQTYLDTIRDILSKGKQRALLIETKFCLEWIHGDVSGTSDAVIFDAISREMWVVDYKHGVGTEVFPERNPQCMIYALGAIQTLWMQQTPKTRAALTPEHLVEKVHLVIVQPRLRGSDEPVKEWETSSAYLQFWAWMMLKPAATECDEDEAFLKTGEGCKWCPSIATCPAYTKHALEVAKTELEEPIFADEGSLTDDELCKVMLFKDRMVPWVEAVTKYAETRMKEGHHIPGFKLVRSRKNRAWVSEEDAKNAIVPALGDAAFKTSLITVKQAEDALKKKKLVVPNFETLWSKAEGDLIVVPEDDKRPAEAIGAITDFMENIDILN